MARAVREGGARIGRRACRCQGCRYRRSDQAGNPIRRYAALAEDEAAGIDGEIRQAGEPDLPFRDIDRPDEFVVLEQLRVAGTRARPYVAVKRCLGDMVRSRLEKAPQPFGIDNGNPAAVAYGAEIVREPRQKIRRKLEPHRGSRQIGSNSMH